MIRKIDDKKSRTKRNNGDAVRGFCATLATILLLLSTVALSYVQPALAARFTLLVENDVYTPGEAMVIYGAGAPNDVLVVRLYDPSGHALQFTNVATDSDGFFRESIWVWKEPSVSLPVGTYTIEAISTLTRTDMRTAQVTFAEELQDEQSPQVPPSHTLAIKMDAPAQVSVNEPFRVFIQVTFDGALIFANGTAIQDLLGTSHIHIGNTTTGNTTILLRDKIHSLHEGLFYADVTLDSEGTYIIHAEAFNRGLLSHDSKVITATSSSISTIQESVTELDSRLETTNKELQELQRGIQDTRMSLNDTQSAITGSVNGARDTIHNEINGMQQATGQINSLILPVLALISVIIALQISLFARIRASFR